LTTTISIALPRKPTGQRNGLAGSVWTRDLSLAHQMVRKIKAGMVGVNMHGSIDPALPFGGFKQSGWGREKGRDVLDLYTEVKSVVMAL
jgi:phenylacetaldehyde dehydrogenase